MEEKLYEHSVALEAGVVSAHDPNIGEKIKAYFVMKPDYKDKIDQQDIIEWFNEKKEEYRYSCQVEFLNVPLKTAVGKFLEGN